MGDRRINLKNRLAVILLLLSGSLFAATSTYTFTTGAGTDKWAYDASDTATPPTSGPALTGQIEITDYTNLNSANDVYHSSAIYGTSMPFLNCKFTIGEATSSISQIYVEWEGYNTAFNSTSTQIRIWDFNSSSWTFLDGYDGEAEVVLSSAVTSNFGNYVSGGYLYVYTVGRGAGVGDPPSVLYSDFVKVVVTHTGDATPPAAISNLTALTGDKEGEIKLQWMSPGDDGTIGPLTGQFQIKYSSVNIITASNYGAPPIPTYVKEISTSSLSPGSTCYCVITGLVPGTSYWFAIKTRDENPSNWSVWNSSADAPVGGQNTSAYASAQGDVTEPGQVTGFTAVTGMQVELSWVAPGDDDYIGDVTGGWSARITQRLPD